MAFSAQEIAEAGKIGLDFYLKNNPIDQIAVERPLLRALQSKKVSAPGAKQYIVEQLRYRYQSNFQWFNGAQVVTYNRRQSIEQAQYQWRSAHDGFALDEDRLAQNGIVITDDNRTEGTSSSSQAERIQLTNLIQEQSEILRLGFEEKFSQALHLDGTQGTDNIEGLDKLVATDPTTGSPGQINRALGTNVWWRNNFKLSLNATLNDPLEILTNMETQWRNCVRNGGRPDLILMGSTYFDTYRKFLMNNFGKADMPMASERTLEGGTKMLTFHNVDCIWSPEFADLDTLYAPSIPWEKRCYMLQTKNIRLRPLEGHDMITRKPPRAYDKYEYYWGLTWRGAMTMNRSNAHAVLAVA